jgi:uncharacterized repeat protein (TIGR03837 family)
VQALPWLTQIDYDHLLWSCDLNFVRGEDSLVRAIWSGHPFVWQIYPQRDGAHRHKLSAFLQRVLDDPAGTLTAGVNDAMQAWNGCMSPPDATPLAAAWSILNDRLGMAQWRSRCSGMAERLSEAGDLTTQLIAFVKAREDDAPG